MKKLLISITCILAFAACKETPEKKSDVIEENTVKTEIKKEVEVKTDTLELQKITKEIENAEKELNEAINELNF